MRLFEFSTLSLSVDNPGGEWVRGQQAYCREEGKNEYGAPSRFGPVTGSFNRSILVPVKFLAQVNGVMGEQSRTREDDLSWLKGEMGQNNRLPLGHSGNQYAPFIVVDYTGMPWVNEGNHRIKAALELGWKYLPIELRYFSGGEDSNGLFSPEKVKKYDSIALAAGYKPGNDFQGKIDERI